MKAIVTGGAGFIGSNIALALEDQGAKVTVIDDFSSAGLTNLKGFRGEVIARDVNDVEWNRLGPVDAVFHEAALTDTTVSDQKRMMHTNLEGFRKVLEYASKHGCPLIYASSAAVYGNEPAPQSESGLLSPLNAYGYSKYLADRMASRVAKEESFRVIGLRYFNVYGMGEQGKGRAASMIYQLAQQIRSGKRPRIFYDGEQSRDHICVKDVVATNLKSLEAKRSGIVNIGTGQSTTFNRLIEILNDVLATQITPDYFENPYPFYQNETRADTTQAEQLIGFKARFTIDAGVRDYLTTLYGVKPERIKSA